MGHRLALDRLAAMADRGLAPPGDPRGHPEEIWPRADGAGRRPGEDGDPRRQQRASLRLLAEDDERGAERPSGVLQVDLRKARQRAHQPRLRLHQQRLTLFAKRPAAIPPAFLFLSSALWQTAIAAATSCRPVPVESNTMISSAASRPGLRPAITS